MAKQQHTGTKAARALSRTKVSPPPAPVAIQRVFGDFLSALLIIAIVLGIKLLVERTSLMEQFDLIGYTWLQNRLYANIHPDDLPVQILDIGNLSPVYVAGALTPVTPRDRLLELLKALAYQQPAAMGVDIDFSQNEHGYRDPQHDPAFFQSVAELRERTGVPIFLGIADSAGLPSSEWLPGGYQKLAACILVPRNDDRKTLKALRIGGAEPGPTMSVALASPLLHRNLRERPWLTWAFRQFEDKKLSEAISAEEFAVDYSPTAILEHDKLSTISSRSIEEMGQRFKGKVVLIGDATVDKASAGDNFPMPTHPWATFPGIYIHACAVYTLLRSPLYEATFAGRVCLDLILSLLVVAAVFGIRGYYARRTVRPVAAKRLQVFFSWLAAIGTLCIGLVLVAEFGILWDDFLIVCAVLLIHPGVEEHVERFFHWMAKTAPAAWQRLVFGVKPDRANSGQNI